MSRLDSRARRLLELRERAALAERAADEAKRERDLYEESLWSELEDLGMTSVTLDLDELPATVKLNLWDEAKAMASRALESVRKPGDLPDAAALLERAARKAREAQGTGYGRVQLARKKTVYHQVIDWPTLEKALQESGMSRELSRLGPRKGALNEFVRSAQEAGRELPPGLGYREDKYVSVTKRPRTTTKI